MILITLIGLPLIGGILAWIAGRSHPQAGRWITVLTLLGMLGIALSIGYSLRGSYGEPVSFTTPWIPGMGISFSLFADGLSLPLIILSILISLLAVIISWNTVTKQVGAFHFNVLSVLSGTLGVFLAADLFLFFFFWELMVVPMAFIIAFWGEKESHAAATKFFLFTQLSGLLMLISTIGLVLLRAAQPGLEISFLYADLLDAPIHGGRLFMLGFFIAFAVKLPVAPFHAWQADAYTRAPIGGTLILAGFLAKTGGYGLLRFCLPLFPEASQAFLPWAFLIGVFTIIYGAMLAYGQVDAKRLIAFSSLSHMGFILIGCFSGNIFGMQGALVFMISHGFATSALFILVDSMERRLGHRDIEKMGGLASLAPRFAAICLFFVLASLGLPASGNFVGEILILVSAFQEHPILGAIIAVGLVFPAVYSLYFIQKALHGKPAETMRFSELTNREYLILMVMAVVVLFIGLRPQSIMNEADPALQRLKVYQAAEGAPEATDVKRAVMNDPLKELTYNIQPL